MTREIPSYRRDFEILSARNADRIAVIDAKTERQVPYGEFRRLVLAAAGRLRAMGATADTTVVSLLPNSLEAILVFLAVAEIGAGFAPFSPLGSAREVVTWCKMVKSGLVLTASPEPQDLTDAIRAAGFKVSTIPVDGSLDFLSDDDKASQAANGGEERPVSRIYLQTSGTTGTPKVMVINFDRLWASAGAWVRQHQFLNETTRFINYLPVSYLGGLFNLALIPMASGGSFVITDSFSGTSLLSFWGTVKRFEVNTLWLVPTIARGLLKLHPRVGAMYAETFKSVRAAFLGTAIIDRETKEAFERDFGFPLLENFALSETTFITSETLAKRLSATERGVGECLPYVDMKLLPTSADGETFGDGIGEIAVRSPYLFMGYLQPDGSVSSPFDTDGFFRTGDLARYGQNGETVYLIGRIRDIVKKGGYLVSLNEIEHVAEQHPEVAEAAAVGIKHEFYGEDVALFLCLKSPGNESVVAEVRDWLSSNLAKFKWPAKIVVVETLPRTASGKLQKFKLAASLGA